MRKRLAMVALCASIAAMALAAAPAQAAFGLNEVDVTFTGPGGEPSMQAGSHPFAWTTHFAVNTTEKEGIEVPDEEARDILAQLPPGLLANPSAVPPCSAAEFTAGKESECPAASALGVFDLTVGFGAPNQIKVPVYNLVPPPGSALRFGFRALGLPVVADGGISPTPPYNAFANSLNISNAIFFYNGDLTFWGNPSSPVHDAERGECFISPQEDSCPSTVAEKPFTLLPRSCSGPLVTKIKADSWLHPGAWLEYFPSTHDGSKPPSPLGLSGCSKLSFTPQIDSRASTDSAETGSGLDFSIDFHDEGMSNPDGIAQSDIKRTVVTLPQGMTINPSIGEGLGVCTPADLARETLTSSPGEGCPNSSKIGTVRVDSPLVEEPVEGSVYLAQQDDPATTEPGAENPFDSLLAFYILLKNPNLGVLVKVPAKVEPDPLTGQLITTVDEIPQLPFSRFSFHFREGQRAPLVSPPACGTYTTKALFTPWARPEETLSTTSSFKVTRGIGGGPCPPGGVPPFKPEFEAGSVNNNAKAYSPFDMRLIRHDGEQDMTKFSSVLPPGVLGKLAGVSKCPDSAIATARAKTGRQELASPSCPANSQIGHTLAGAGVGGALTYVPGEIYLGGPYHGDPLSVIAITPGVAGPFDAGTVVTRVALTLNPETAEVEVDGANSDPIPHILKGIVLKVREIRVFVDRPEFILNPTSCDPSSAKATLFGGYLDVFSPADDVPVALSSRYQAANCLNLGFKPKLSLKLNGGTHRGDHPALKAVLRARPGDANIGAAVVTLPTSAFLDQAHIRTICTRVQFAAKACPKGAQYGYARAWSPLLDEVLQGPVYLRSSNHKLPDLVAALHGIVDVNVVGRIDSYKGGIRSSFETVPDAPVTKFILTMQGGEKGLVINSRSLCARKSKADALFTGQNGVADHFHPLVEAQCAKKK